MKRQYLDTTLKEYTQEDYYPFHMPGHKRQWCPEALKMPYQVDITEIDGFDNLHHAEGILLEAQERIAALYGADKSYYLVNGSTAGILSAVSACTSRNGKLLMARNCHKAAYHAAYLRGLYVNYLYPQSEQFTGLNGGISPEDVKKALEREPDTEAVLITSPTYDGIVSDIEEIAKIVHDHEIPLIVDEAHGAHFRFSDYFPDSALGHGADIVIQSLHKTMPSMTQTAVLHTKGTRVSEECLKRFLGIYQSSSPSYVFMAGMDACVRLMEEQGSELFQKYVLYLDDFREKMENLKYIHVTEPKDLAGKGAVYDLDRSKLIITCRDNLVDGETLYGILLEKYHLQMEMAASRYVIALTSVMDTEEGFKRLYQALWEIDRNLQEEEPKKDQEKNKQKNEGLYKNEIWERDSQEYIFEDQRQKAKREIYCTISQGTEALSEEIRLEESAGRISSEYAYLYPPGIPFLVPGERISKELLEDMKKWKEQGLDIQGPNDYTLKKISVHRQIKETEKVQVQKG